MPSYAILTQTGRNKEAAALATGEPITITDMAWGDGARLPAGAETALENEQGRKPVQAKGATAGALNQAFFEILLTEEEGPFVIREVGLFDEDGDMIAVAHYDPEINKPVNTISATLRINVLFSDLENLVIQIDNTTAFVPASRRIDAGTGLSGGGDMSEDRTISADIASQAEATAGTSASKLMTALRVRQAIDGRTSLVRTTRSISAGTGLTGGGSLSSNRTISANIASLAQALAGTSVTTLMTPERVRQAISGAFSATLAGTGEYQFPPDDQGRRFTIKWGVASGNGTTLFTDAFLNTCLIAFANDNRDSAVHAIAIGFTRTAIITESGDGGSCFYFAIGY